MHERQHIKRNISRACSDRGRQEALDSDFWITTKQAASLLGFAPITLVKWRQTDVGPKFVSIGRAIRYRKTDIDEFMGRCRQKTDRPR